MLKAIVLPELDGTGALLQDFAAFLAGHFEVQVIAYPVDEPLRYPQLCELVRGCLPRGDFVLIAESFSGPIALALAAERPPGLKALVLCASFARVELPGKAWLSRCISAIPLRAVPAALLSALLWGRWRTRGRTQVLADVLSRVDEPVLRTRAREALAADATRVPPPSVPAALPAGRP